MLRLYEINYNSRGIDNTNFGWRHILRYSENGGFGFVKHGAFQEIFKAEEVWDREIDSLNYNLIDIFDTYADFKAALKVLYAMETLKLLTTEKDNV